MKEVQIDLFGKEVPVDEVDRGSGRKRKESDHIVFRKMYGFDDRHKCASCAIEPCPGRGVYMDRACSMYEERRL